MKKIILTIFISMFSLLLLTSCANEPPVTTEEDYPYMDFFENSVTLLEGVLSLESDKMTALSGTIGANTAYSGIKFKVKEGTNIKSITFSLTAAKDCKVFLYAYSNAPDFIYDRGVYSYIDKTVDVARSDYLIDLKANEVSTFTIETVSINKGIEYDSGLYPVGTSEERSILELKFKIKDENPLGYDYFYLGSINSYIEEEFTKCNVKFSNISFDVESL